MLLSLTVYTDAYGRRDIVVGKATRYRVDGLGLKTRRGRDFPHPLSPVQRPTQSSVYWTQVLLPGGTVAGVWPWQPTRSNTEVDSVNAWQFYVWDFLSGWRHIQGALPSAWTFAASCENSDVGRVAVSHRRNLNLIAAYVLDVMLCLYRVAHLQRYILKQNHIKWPKRVFE